MKKIVCPRCGVVNLEKFVTFPHCAGCSALLPNARAPRRASVWRRPLRAGFWAGLVGIAMAGAVALSFSPSETRESHEPQKLIVYAQLARQARLGEVVVCQLGIDSAGNGAENSVLHDVSWRLARSSERDWRVVSVSPLSDASDTPAIGSVHNAWVYRRWTTEERWTLRLQPRARGKRPLAIVAKASDHFPIQWRTTVTVR